MGFRFDMEYEIGGRKVSQREWERHLQSEAEEIGRKNAAERVRGMRCPEHGEGVTVKPAPGGIKLETCCDEHVAAAMQRIGATVA